MRFAIRDRCGAALWAFCRWAVRRFEGLRRLAGRTPVQTIETETLRAAVQHGDSKLLVVDVRSPAERAVSVIPQAIERERFETMRRDQDPALHDRHIVTYCTVGARSYLAAWRLQREGLQAFNYADSILGWVHAGLPLTTPAGQPTQDVHPYWMLMPIPPEYQATKQPRGHEDGSPPGPLVTGSDTGEPSR